MDDFKNAGLGTFEEELQALVDYGHDCCARIDDKIHECCERIKKAHDVEVGGYAIALGWKEQQGEWATTYDVLGNERHKAVCKLREMPKLYPNKDGGADLYAWKFALANAIGANTELFSAIRDRLIYLLGGDQPTLSELFGILREDDDGVDARPSDSASADSPVHGAAGCGCGGACDCDGEELLAPITTELRDSMSRYCNFATENIVSLSEEEFDHLCDNIDAIHAGLERENEELRKRTMYPSESERINMLEREVKRLAAECKTQRNNFDQATSAREHWKNLYEQALEHIHDLERDYEVACRVNEKQEREYLEWYNRASRMQKEIDDLKAKSGVMWQKGYHECHEELMEGNDTLAADLEKAGWMMLPKDSDGVPVRIGDMMEWPDTTTAEVVGVGDGTFFYVEVGETVAHWTRTHDKIHHVQESVEDTLREFARAWTEWQDGAPIMNPVESFAAKLRLADDEEVW